MALDEVENGASMCMSRLSIESYDADEEGLYCWDDSDNELGSSCYSLPSTPPRRRKQVKDYASDNGGKEKGTNKTGGPRRRRRRRVSKLEGNKEQTGFSTGESDHSCVMLITRPKGGKRSLCMDLEEVRACKDLGFELEHQLMLDIPAPLSFSNSTLDTSSGSNSPITNWRISAPGDDPRDVKARLKVWAQAVALASASKYAT